MGDQPQQLPLKVVVEVVTPEIVSRLEGDNALLRQEVKQLRDRVEATHMTVYRLMETVAELKRERQK